MGCAFDDYKIFVLALRSIVMFFPGRNEIVRTGRNNKQRDRDIR